MINSINSIGFKEFEIKFSKGILKLKLKAKKLLNFLILSQIK